MSRDNSPHEASEPDQLYPLPLEHTDTHNHVTSGQLDLIQTLEDSQETSLDIRDDGLALKQSPRNPRSAQPAGGTFFTRPDMETAEEIAAGFRYQKPPHTILHSSMNMKRQSTKSLPSSSNVQLVSQSREIPATSKTQDNCRTAEASVPSTSCRDERQIHTNSPHGSDPIDHETNSCGSSSDIARNGQLLDVGTSDRISDKVPSGFPFPADEPNPLRRRERSKRTSPSSHHSLGQLPKSMLNTVQKARMQLSPRSRAPGPKTITPPSSNHINQPAHALTMPDQRVHSENNNHLANSRPHRDNNGITDDFHVHDVERTSIKSSRIPRQKRDGLTRPIPADILEDEVVAMRRPGSQVSNISRRRAPSKSYHQTCSPTREQGDLYLKKFAKTWNANYVYNQGLLDRWEKKIKLLEQHIMTRDSTIKQFQRDIRSRDETIDGLSDEVEELRSQGRKIQDEIAVSSAARKKLEEKLRSCRDRLNSAILEQQKLFLQNRETCQKGIADVNAESQVWKEAVEKATATAELMRAEIKQEVTAVVNDATRQAEELNRTIEVLETELRERQMELEREREHAACLNEQLSESNKLNSQSLQSLATQNQELLEKLKHDRMQAESAEVCIRNQDEKIDAILKALEEARSKTIDPMALVEDVQQSHSETVARIVKEVQSSAISTGQTLSEGVSEIRLLCEGAVERTIRDNEIAQWQQRAQDSSMVADNHESRIRNLQAELIQLHAQLGEQRGERNELEKQLTVLQVASQNEQAANKKVNGLAEQVSLLKITLKEKDATITKSNEDLEVAQEELRTQARKLRDREAQIESDRQKHEDALKSSAQKREEIVHAATKETQEIREKHRLIEKQLLETNMARKELEKELAKSRQAEELSGKVIDADLFQIQDQIGPILTLITKLTSGLDESESEREVLRGVLEEWSHDRRGMNDMRQVLGRLAKEQPNMTQMGNELKELLTIQKKLTGTLDYHQAKLLNAEATVATACSHSLPDSTMATVSGSICIPADDSQRDATSSTEEFQNLKRKVVVKSPITEDDRASPMSVEQERSARRQLGPPRGIMKMKMITRSVSRGLEAAQTTPDVDAQTPTPVQPVAKRKIARRGSKTTLTTHSMYNRPVAGSVIGASEEQVDTSQAGSYTYRSDATVDGTIPDLEDIVRGANPIHDMVQDDDLDEHQPKRQRILQVGQQQGQESNIAERPVLSRSMSEHFSAAKVEGLKPTGRMSLGTMGVLSRGVTGEKRLTTYGMQSSGKASQNQPPAALTTSDALKSADSQSAMTSSQTMGSSSS
ncbi:hypothetical protein GGR54DRAFT_651480 [Hypoxylon sp. NC1633]|nr:hypothetical protein GGR54DRAFT_651480 [Hypoxylon sp. NC1633]